MVFYEKKDDLCSFLLCSRACIQPIVLQYQRSLGIVKLIALMQGHNPATRCRSIVSVMAARGRALFF